MTGPSPDQIARGRVATKQEIVHIHGFLSGSSGYLVDAHGLHSLPGNVWAVQDAPAPLDVSQLLSYYIASSSQTCQLCLGHFINCSYLFGMAIGTKEGKCFSSLEATAGVVSVVGAL